MKYNLCSDYQSQFAFINNKQIHIEEYFKNLNLYQDMVIKCNNNHELILVNGIIIKSHFRHKHNEDINGNPMTKWHKDWQREFPVTEVEFKRKNSDQIKNRRADVLLKEHKNTVEFQHSEITKDEVNDRKNDYKINELNIKWVIHGNNSIIVNTLEYSNRVYLEFISDHWKHESFIEYDCIYFDINNEIYKVNPKKIKSYMIDVEYPKSKNDFINSLKNNTDIWLNEEPKQTNLFIKQQGAGNGKTYGIIQMLESDNMLHYEYFIFVTKQHSAKYVIKTELDNQIKNNQLKYIKNVNVKDESKKYIITYYNTKINKECQLIIATIDSLMNAIGNKKSSGCNKFQSIVNSIIDDYIKTDKSGKIKYAGIDPKLNKEILLVLDEAQDLEINYAQAIIQIMKNKYIDAYIVGDKLQSISNNLNSFTYLYDNEFPNINTTIFNPENICRRFINDDLIKFINTIVPFDKYNLPSIQPYKTNNIIDNNSCKFIFGKTIYADESNKDAINNEVDIIMNDFKNEVEQNNRIPNDFLIITPFVTKNPLVDALQLAIDMYWKNKIGCETEDYIRYAVFHKSEEGNSIDLEESKDATRIVSIHSSKGDGRNVVFVIGLTERAINVYSGEIDNLIYDSLIHVALTRMKERLYIRIENNYDDIAKKINKYIHNNIDSEYTVKPDFYISNTIKYNGLIKKHSTSSYDEFNKTIINKTNIIQLEDSNEEKKIIDMGNHLIRFASLSINIQCEIMNKEIKYKNEFKKQIKEKWREVSDCDINCVYTWKLYNTKISQKELTIIRLSDKGRDYTKYYNIIYDNMKNIQQKLKNLKNKLINLNDIPILCPFECIILHYMLQIKQNGTKADTNINDIYNIVDVYNNSFDSSLIGHDNCKCKTSFNNTNENINKNVHKMKDYLHNHFDKVKDIKNSLLLFHETYLNISWLINHSVTYNGKNDNFKLWRERYQLIGYNDNIVIIGYIKPQFNTLNFNEVLMNSIFDTYLISHVKNEETSDNYEKFNGKKIISVVFTLDRKEPYYIDWKNLIDDELLQNTTFNYLKETFITENNRIFYFYKYWRKYSTDSDFPTFLIDEYTKIKNDYLGKNPPFPSYIDEFLNKIKFKIQLDKKKKNAILAEYDNKEYFMNELNDMLSESLKRFLGIPDEESDEEMNDNILNT